MLAVLRMLRVKRMFDCDDKNGNQILYAIYLYIYIFILLHDGSYVVEMCVHN